MRTEIESIQSSIFSFDIAHVRYSVHGTEFVYTIQREEKSVLHDLKNLYLKMSEHSRQDTVIEK